MCERERGKECVCVCERERAIEYTSMTLLWLDLHIVYAFEEELARRQFLQTSALSLTKTVHLHKQGRGQG